MQRARGVPVVKNYRPSGVPVTPDELLADLLGHLRRGYLSGPFCQSVQQRYVRAVEMVAAYDRAKEIEEITRRKSHA